MRINADTTLAPFPVEGTAHSRTGARGPFRGVPPAPGGVPEPQPGGVKITRPA